MDKIQNKEKILIGALAPLTAPGWIEAGRSMVAGFELAKYELNVMGGINGLPIELLIRDTAADPQKASDIVAEMANLNVVAIVGEYHSIVARAVAVKADELSIPFLCSSAVIDNLIATPSKWIARLSPVQSKGWKIYAEHLLKNGHTRIAVAIAHSIYWASGTSILRTHFEKHGGTVIEIDTQLNNLNAVCDKLIESEATALLLLTGYPNPAISLVKAIRNEPKLKNTLIGAPAGQPEFYEWDEGLQSNSFAIPFLRYMPEKLNSLGTHILNTLRHQLGEEPSFVSLEAYDAVKVIAKIMTLYGANRDAIAEAWPLVVTEGTRGRISFSRKQDFNVWQWEEAPIQVVDRDPTNRKQFRTLYTSKTQK